MKYLLEEHEGITVVRDDIVPGGTKARILPRFLTGAPEWVYGTPAYGYAQIALAESCAAMGLRATIFVAKRKVLHPRTQTAKDAGAKIIQVPHGYMSNVQKKARDYCAYTGARLLPFGFNFPGFIDAMAELAAGLDIDPPEVWTVAGSGTLSRALQKAWPRAEFNAVKVGGAADVGRARLYEAPERFEDDAEYPPPFPSCSNYDAKAWRFIKEKAGPGALFWNVAA